MGALADRPQFATAEKVGRSVHLGARREKVEYRDSYGGPIVTAVVVAARIVLAALFAIAGVAKLAGLTSSAGSKPATVNFKVIRKGRGVAVPQRP